MTATEIVSLLTGITGLIAVILAFLPQLWAKAKIKAEAKTETAQEAKVRADAAAVQVGTSLDIVARLDDQVKRLIIDLEKKEQQQQEMTRQLAITQQQFAEMQALFNDCKSKLDNLWAKNALDVTPDVDVKSSQNVKEVSPSPSYVGPERRTNAGDYDGPDRRSHERSW